MIDINILRENPEIILNSLDHRQDKIDLEQIINLDNQKRKLIQQSDDLKNQKNIVSKKLGQADKKPISLIEEMREAGNQIKNLDLKLEKVSTKLNYLLSTIPNLVSNNVPYGKNEDENEVIKSVG